MTGNMQLLAALLLLMTSPAPPLPARLPPVDRCAADPSFGRFRAELLSALERRDREHLLAIVAEDIMVDFGGGQGRAAFIEHWGLGQPKESGLWAELGQILRLGCTMQGGTASSPSLMDQLPADRDAFMTLLAVKPGAALREAPSEASPAIRRLDWDLLTLAPKGAVEGWFAVMLEDGGTGYVLWEHVRSPVDYRAVFSKQSGRWAMTVLVAGD
jgi:hypothetical protein